ncbi:fatty acid oxygenase [Neurospora crassa OR74A]|uniref:Fatty acid oxygenase n=1 Tax=Neurospora crassa (strain ATCC 24698 / 74-OR23-1A / CBS 708.71 / DSM 1257 / FGSC 987) TaxID=367110 RepID=Q7S550_NEUCR|nr:fatty acid oxygenase [Neurospora crassa OR74A]EAA30613.1 fatty acid oxygenase [Neurospora crassa OR74A]|eukprot:XP_959849.1 fatty acid oxygenase [Neurospora crassa OR74A]
MSSHQNGTNGHSASTSDNGKESKSRNVIGPDPKAERTASMAKPRPTSMKLPFTGASRQGVENAFERHRQTIQSAVQPLPTQQGAGTFSENKKWGKLSSDLMTLRWADIKTLKHMVVAKIKGERLADDKTMIMEKVIQLVSNLPSNSKLRVELTNGFLGELWYTLEHPPSIYVGEYYQYRKADGSCNNIMFPQLGAAGTTYARSVRPNVIRQGALPDPELIFDSVMKRTEYKSHPNNVSSILWYWASIIIHDLFWTDYRDMSKSKTSSYLDLSPLYGSNQDMQDTIRTFKDGKLKVDCYADKRLLGMPPGVSVLLIFFNRFHNYTCDNLIAINEDGRFNKPSPKLEGEKAEAAWKKYDNDLFQTARLITSGLYINITLLDYVRNIVNLNRVDTTWTLDPRADTGIDVGTKDGAERGTGNVVSAEFNLCYRWHSCISAKDEAWIEDFYYELFGKPGSDLSFHELIMGFGKFEGGIPADPADRPIRKDKGHFSRDANGKISDDELAECIADAIEDPAGSFGAKNVPPSMRAVEILGIIQGRKWNLAGLNEFRKHFGLKPYETFEDINSDPGVSEALRRLYDHPDFVELYPGIVAEEHKSPMVPGVGIAPTYTISRVVLSDAVCLVRGDRHYTIDYNPRNLTNWGYNEVQYDLNLKHGCVFYKLFMRALPNHFKENSVYAHYPMVTPAENKKILTDLKRDHLFDWARPTRQPKPHQVKTHAGAQHVLDNDKEGTSGAYMSSWHAGLESLLGKPLSNNNPDAHDSQRRDIHEQLYSAEWADQVKAFFAQTTDALLAGESYNVGGHLLVDLVRDVGNIVPTLFAAKVFGISLQTKNNTNGLYTPQELYAVLAVIFAAIFYDHDPVKTHQLRDAARTVATQLGTALESAVKSQTSFFGSLLGGGGSGSNNNALTAYGNDLVKRLSKAGLSASDVAFGQVLPIVASSVPSIAEAFASAADFYLGEKGQAHLGAIQELARQPASASADAQLLGYVLEGIRLSGNALGAFRQASAVDAIKEEDGSEVRVQPGDRVFVSVKSAAQSPTTFPSPEEVNPSRPLEAYKIFFFGTHSYLGHEVSQIALREMFRSLFKRSNVRRAPGPQGQLKKITRELNEELSQTFYLREDWGAVTPFPVTMKVTWDE